MKKLIQFKTAFVSSVKLFFSKISKEDLLTQSAALSYYCALSLAPLIVLFLSLLSFMGDATRLEFLTQIKYIMGDQASQAVSLIIEGSKTSTNIRSLSQIIGFFTLLVSASSVFSQLKNTITIIFGVEAEDDKTTTKEEILNFLRKKLFSVGIMVSFIFISVVSLLFSVALSVVLPSGEGTIWHFLTQFLNIIVYGIIFFLVFRYVPDKKIDKKDALIGGFISSALFIAGKGLLSVYLSSAAVSSAYGATGSLIALLIWVYYSSFIVFASAVITSILPGARKMYKKNEVKE